MGPIYIYIDYMRISGIHIRITQGSRRDLLESLAIINRYGKLRTVGFNPTSAIRETFYFPVCSPNSASSANPVELDVCDLWL